VLPENPQISNIVNYYCGPNLPRPYSRMIRMSDDFLSNQLFIKRKINEKIVRVRVIIERVQMSLDECVHGSLP